MRRSSAAGIVTGLIMAGFAVEAALGAQQAQVRQPYRGRQTVQRPAQPTRVQTRTQAMPSRPTRSVQPAPARGLTPEQQLQRSARIPERQLNRSARIPERSLERNARIPQRQLERNSGVKQDRYERPARPSQFARDFGPVLQQPGYTGQNGFDLWNPNLDAGTTGRRTATGRGTREPAPYGLSYPTYNRGRTATYANKNQLNRQRGVSSVAPGLEDDYSYIQQQLLNAQTLLDNQLEP